MSTHNEGFYVAGGQVNTGPIATGRGAHITVSGDVRTQSGTRAPEVEQALQRLLDLLERERSQLPDPEQVRADTASVEQELSKASPDQSALARHLTAVGAGAGAVTSVVTAVRALASAAGVALGAISVDGLG